MSLIRRSLIWFGLLTATFSIVGVLRQSFVLPTARGGVNVRITNPDQVVISKPAELVVFTLTLQNSGSESVVITGCEVGCTCTTPVGLPLTLAANSECNLSFKLKANDHEGSVARQEIRVYTMPPAPDLFAIVVSRVEAQSPVTLISE